MKAAVATPTGDGAGTTLEAFVAQLQREGVAAGQQEAERLLRAAQEEAAEIVRRARAEADAALAQAREAAAREQERGRAELELAARDTLLRLQSAVEGALGTLLRRGVDGTLRDPEYLRTLLTQVVGAYARDDAAGRVASVRLPHASAAQLERWSAQLLAHGLSSDAEITASLREAGFEYRLGGGATVEVSTPALVERLLELLRPRLREVMSAAAQPAAGRDHPAAASRTRS